MMRHLSVIVLVLVFVAVGSSSEATVVLGAGPVVRERPELQEQILDAARSGNLNAAQKLLNSHPKLVGNLFEVNGCFGITLTALHEASRNGHLSVAKLLVSKGAKADARDSMASTPLHFATSPEMASFLLSKGAKLEAKNRYGHTPLHNAAAGERKAVASLLRSKGAKVATIFDAVLVGDAALVRKMLDRNPKLVQVSERPGQTPLWYAASTGQVAMAKLLLDRGAKPSSGNIESEPLEAAIHGKHIEITRLLLERGANPNCQMIMGAPLSAAAWLDYRDIAKVLIEHGAKVNATAEGIDLPPLHNAVFYEHDKMAELLIEHGADVNMKMQYGRTPLHFAASARSANGTCVTLLLDRGADVNAKTDKGNTPLTGAQSKTVVRILLEHGATVNNAADAALAGDTGKLLEFVRSDPSVLKRTRRGRPLLHLAATGGNPEAVEMLIARGMKPNEPDVNGETPLHFAAKNGNTEAARVLIAHGAHVNARSMNRIGSETSLTCALEAGQKETAGFLKKAGGKQ